MRKCDSESSTRVGNEENRIRVNSSTNSNTVNIIHPVVITHLRRRYTIAMPLQSK